MGEVKRYDMRCVGCCDMAEAVAVEDSDGVYVEHSDYARIERERDELAQRESRLIEDFNEVCACRDRFVTRYTEAKAQLTRLRAVEAELRQLRFDYNLAIGYNP